MSTTPATAEPFALAWRAVEQAGGSRPFVPPVPSPALQAVDAGLAWRLAHLLAEATALQQALGEWVGLPQTKTKEIEAALAGLRRGPRGPRWWRRLSQPIWLVTLSNWRHTLETFRAQVQARHQQTQGLLNAVEKAQVVLTQALAEPRPVEAGEWAFQASLLVQTLETVKNRIALREGVEADSVETANRGLAALGLLQNRRGLTEEQAWEAARRRLNGPI